VSGQFGGYFSQEGNEIEATRFRPAGISGPFIEINQTVRADTIRVISNPAVFIKLNDGSGFLLGAAIVAPPPHRNPFWMLVDPLGDVGLRI
jgi:hypothetical protein